MTQDPHGAHADAPQNGSLNGRLDGWKEIAAYLNRGVRTAQRWEQELGMPVRRLDTGGAELGQYAQVVEVLVAPGGMIRIRVVQAGDPMLVGTAGSAYYTLDSAFRIADGELNPDVGPIQRKYEAEHLVSSATRPRGDADLYPVLRWNGAGYDRIDGPEIR